MMDLICIVLAYVLKLFEYYQPFPLPHFPIIAVSIAQMLLQKIRRKVPRSGKQKLA